jgi:hypothetical protein
MLPLGRRTASRRMLIYLYLFGLIVGGVLLGSSLLLGGHGEAEVDAELDAEVGGDAEVHVDDHGSGIEVGADLVLWRFRSLRFWTFFLAFFGLSGTLLGGWGSSPRAG